MIDTLCMANGWCDTKWRLWIESFMIPSRLDYRCIAIKALDTGTAADS
jgi:hypothetical protein